MAIASRAAAPSLALPVTVRPRPARIVAALPVLVPLAVAGGSVGPMVLLLAGAFVAWLAVALAVVGATAALLVYRLPDETPSRSTVVWTLVAAAVVLIWLLLNQARSAEDFYAQRDPATYQLTARWLMDHHSLDFPTHRELFGALPGMDDSSAGFLDDASGDVYAQGNHLLPALLAMAGTVFGGGAVLKANVALAAAGLFAVYGVGRRIVGGPLAVVVMTALAVAMPTLFVSRDTFSEPLAMLLLFGGLGLLQQAVTTRCAADFALAGGVAGASALVRIDSYVSLLALISRAALWAAAASVQQRRARARQALALLAGGLPLAVLGWLDVTQLAGGYYHNQRSQIVPVVAVAAVGAVLAAAAVAAAWRYDLANRWSLPRVRARWAGWLSAALVAGFALLLSRPLWLTTHGATDNDVVRVAQQAAGDAVDGTRLYAENTLNWQAMYLGWATVGLAAVGYVLLVRRLVLRGDWTVVGVVVMGLSVSALYLWNPQITPDQIWAMRRFVPVVLPAMLVAAAYAVRRLVDTVAARPRWAAPALGIAATLVLVGVPLHTSWPVRNLREQAPQRAQVDALCRAVGDHGAVLAIDDGLRYGYSQTVRSWCGVPAMGLVGATQTELATARASVAAGGRTLYVIAARAEQGRYVTAPPSAPFSSTTVTMWPQSLHTAPTRPRTQSINVYLSTVTADGRLVAVPA